jgi:hypothetical protein
MYDIEVAHWFYLLLRVAEAVMRNREWQTA